MAGRPGETISPAGADQRGTTPQRTLQDIMHPTLTPQQQSHHRAGELLGLLIGVVMIRAEEGLARRRANRVR